MTEQDKINHACCFIKNGVFSLKGKISPYPVISTVFSTPFEITTAGQLS